MISDTERREVAARLRELRSGWSSGECYYTIIHELDLPDTSREDGGAALYARLADLIEPGEPKVRCVAEVKVDGERLEELVHDAAAELTGIDRDALLALAEEMEEFGNLPVKHPGIRVLHNDDFSRELGYARRIRDALGVTR